MKKFQNFKMLLIMIGLSLSISHPALAEIIDDTLPMLGFLKQINCAPSKGRERLTVWIEKTEADHNNITINVDDTLGERKATNLSEVFVRDARDISESEKQFSNMRIVEKNFSAQIKVTSAFGSTLMLCSEKIYFSLSPKSSQ